MNYEVKQRIIDGKKFGLCFIFDRAVCSIFIDRKYKRSAIYITKKEKTNRKKIDLSEILKIVIEYINNNHEYIKKDEFTFEDILKCSNIRNIELNNLKIENKDIEIIKNKFSNLMMYESHNCTYYRNCNLGILNCDIRDKNSDIYDFGMFNGYKGKYLELRKSNIIRMNCNVLHLNNEFLQLSGVNLDYEKFFLTTDAPNLRKLCIYRYPHYKILNDLDLLFISGFYNLESIDIDGVIANYSQIEKLEKLREIKRLYITDKKELEIIEDKYKDKKIYKELLEINDEDRINNFLISNRMHIQNRYQEFFHKLYVSRLESVVWKDKVSLKDLQKIKTELLKISEMNSFERNKIARDKRKTTSFDSLMGLDFDYKQSKEEEYLISSRTFSGEGINYYVKDMKLILDEWGSTYGRYKY